MPERAGEKQTRETPNNKEPQQEKGESQPTINNKHTQNKHSTKTYKCQNEENHDKYNK